MVSVIIPNYNHASFMTERIESVLNQTYDNFEVIILDDKSTDNSVEIIERYRNHPKVSHVILNGVNSGSTFKQWHKGFQLAKGEYIWIAESDDVAHPDFLSELMTAVSKGKDITLAASAITLIDESGDITGYESISKSRRVRYYSGDEFIKENMLLGNHLLNASSALIRKDVLSKIPNDYTCLKASGDYLFWIEIARLGNVVELPSRLDYFRRSATTVTPRLYSSGRAFEEAHIVFNRLRELGYAKGYYRHLIVGFRLWQLRRIKVFNTSEIKDHCLSIWEAETKSPILDIGICYLHGLYRKIRRKIKNL